MSTACTLPEHSEKKSDMNCEAVSPWDRRVPCVFQGICEGVGWKEQKGVVFWESQKAGEKLYHYFSGPLTRTPN